jgi:hypothetical protein
MQPILLWVGPVVVGLQPGGNLSTAMKKATTAILVFIVFLVSQYARHIAYLECKLSYTNSGQPPCDCEKRFIVDQDADQRAPSPIHHRHIHFDEAYIPFSFPLTASAHFKNDPDCQIEGIGKVLPGFRTDLLRPPLV